MKIWKWEIAVVDTQILPLPWGAKILSIQMQGDACCLWALCNEHAAPEPRRINIFGTGNPMPVNENIGAYVSTFQMHGGALVFHAFEVQP